MRTRPATAVALPGRRRCGALGAAPTLSVQDTPSAARRIGVSWTLKRHHGSAQ